MMPMGIGLISRGNVGARLVCGQTFRAHARGRPYYGRGWSRFRVGHVAARLVCGQAFRAHARGRPYYGRAGLVIEDFRVLATFLRINHSRNETISELKPNPVHSRGVRLPAPCSPPHNRCQGAAISHDKPNPVHSRGVRLPAPCSPPHQSCP